MHEMGSNKFNAEAVQERERLVTLISEKLAEIQYAAVRVNTTVRGDLEHLWVAGAAYDHTRIDSNKSLRTDFALCKVQVYGTITNHFVLFPDESHIAKSAIIPPQLTRDDRERLNDSTMAKDRVIASYIHHGHYSSTLSEEAMLRLLHEPFTYFGPAIGEHIVNRFPFSSEVGVTDHF